MKNDVILNKSAIIERCIRRIREEDAGNPENLINLTKQDSIVLNIQRASKASIDLAMHIIAEHGLGVPQNSREAFDLLAANGYIENDLCSRLKSMVGFCNIAVHDYQALDMSILQNVVELRLEDLSEFTRSQMSRDDWSGAIVPSVPGSDCTGFH